MKNFLKGSVWLPYEPDYDLLTLLVPVTFAQAVFQAVPLVLVTGAPGSGKSALGRAMIKICANAAIVGQTSAAAIARLIDETKGFVVFDDLESIGKRKGRESSHFTEFVQALKLSYNQETSWKMWTDVSRGMSVKRLNFFGVKMINNTTGSDEILGSRLFKIHTRKVPARLLPLPDVSDVFDPVVMSNLRDELHTWTFENVASVDQAYQRLVPSSSDRASEISIPLKVFADLSGNKELQAGLKEALKFQKDFSKEFFDPINLMKQAVTCLINDGQTSVYPTQVVSEMERLISGSPALRSEDEHNWQSSAWVGQKLRAHGIIEKNAPPKRRTVSGKSVRMYDLKPAFLKRALKTNKS